MMHCLFYAFPEFPECERIIANKWGTACCYCALPAKRVLEFAIQDKRPPPPQNANILYQVRANPYPLSLSFIANLDSHSSDASLFHTIRRTHETEFNATTLSNTSSASRCMDVICWASAVLTPSRVGCSKKSAVVHRLSYLPFPRCLPAPPLVCTEI